MKTLFKSFKEYQRDCFPDDILKRLKEAIKKEMQPYSICLYESGDKTGIIDLIRPNYISRNISDLVTSFYEKEGYAAIKTSEAIEVSKKNESYWVLTSGNNYSNIVSIIENPLKSIFRSFSKIS